MSDRGDGIRYTSKEMFQRVEAALSAFDTKLDLVTHQLQAERSSIDLRFAKIEQRMPAVEELIAEFGTFRKSFIGFEQRFSLHEAAPTHPSASQQMTGLLFDVEQLKIGAQTQKRLDDYVKEVQQQHRDQQERDANAGRWRYGLAFTLGVTLLIQVSRVLGWLP